MHATSLSMQAYLITPTCRKLRLFRDVLRHRNRFPRDAPTPAHKNVSVARAWGLSVGMPNVTTLRTRVRNTCGAARYCSNEVGPHPSLSAQSPIDYRCFVSQHHKLAWNPRKGVCAPIHPLRLSAGWEVITGSLMPPLAQTGPSDFIYFR
ncbi:hypothetical protein C8R44DRAFT_879479 [Mycena epipterygia]|nr:hypothetical protein C8R44DRAFT_879479 [Mycena epipterygia]